MSRLAIHPGAGTVIRRDDLLVWVGSSASAELVSYLVAATTSAANETYPGTVLSDQVAAVLRRTNPEPAVPFALVGPGPQGWVALLHGPVQLFDGIRWSVPQRSPGWMLLSLGDPTVLVAAPLGQSPPDPAADPHSDLQVGVTHGAGFAFTKDVESPLRGTDPAPPAATERPEPTTPPAATERPEPTTPPAATEPSEPATPPATPPASADSPEPPDQVAKAQPLPAVSTLPRPNQDGPEVTGRRCRRGHFNHPSASSCLYCGYEIPTNAPLASDRRPSLGVLLRGDGAVFTLDSGYVLGSSPAASPEAAKAGSRPMPLPATAGTDLATTTAEVRLDDWDVVVVDLGSEEGTFLLPPNSERWSRLPAHASRVLLPGSHIACGQWTVTYITPWAN